MYLGGGRRWVPLGSDGYRLLWLHDRPCRQTGCTEQDCC